MIPRRHLLIGGSCLAAAVASQVLQPRRRLRLLGSDKLAQVVPTAFAGWASHDSSDMVDATEPGSLSAKLYSEMVGRAYTQAGGGRQVMALLAYGPVQSDELQLHRPEECYPAFGFALRESRPIELALAPHISVPGRGFVAALADRHETIAYWTRLGEFFPVDPAQQRTARIRTSLGGYVADGLLVRLSVLEQDPVLARPLLQEFARALVTAVAPDKRKALIGSQRAAELARSLA